MFVVWREEVVKGRGGGPFLLDDSDLRASGYAEPWRGLRCEHHGGGRVAWTPFVVEEERVDGQIRQKLLFRLSTIRSCCVADDFNRAAWWHDAEWAIRVWGESGDYPLDDDLARDRPAILSGLREVIPRPTPAAVRAFAEFRSDRDDEDQARDSANRDYWNEQVRRNQRQISDDRESRPPDCFKVLGLRQDSTLDQIKRRHRHLAKQHHPDRGGDPSQFRIIQDAYERASEEFERRNTS